MTSPPHVDPDKLLTEIRILVARIYRHWEAQEILPSGQLDVTACRLAELIDMLDEWICRGGFPPGDWRTPPWTVRAPLDADRPSRASA